MQVIVLAPFLSGPLRGNAVHAERKARLLAEAGLEVTMLDGSAEFQNIPKADCLVALHAWRNAAKLDAILDAKPMPFVLVTTGTDVPPGLPDDKRSIAEASFARADQIVVQHPEQKREIAEAFPHLDIETKTSHVPPSVKVELQRPAPAFGSGGLEILHISGIRPIKGVGFVPEYMAKLWKRFPEARYTLLGAAIEDDYARPVLEWIEANQQAQRFEGLSHQESLAHLAKADVLLSTSRHEGLSNALLEAMALGTPVVATSIAPNRELIEDGATGLLYDGKAGFIAALTRLAEEPGLAASLADAAQAMVARKHSPAIEQALLLAALDNAHDRFRAGHRR